MNALPVEQGGCFIATTDVTTRNEHGHAEHDERYQNGRHGITNVTATKIKTVMTVRDECVMNDVTFECTMLIL